MSRSDIPVPSEIEHVIEHGDRNGTVQIAPDAYPADVLNAIRARLTAEGFNVAVAFYMRLSHTT